MKATEPESIKNLAKEVATAFDATLLTTHPSEDGRSEWLLWMELDTGETYSQYANPILANSQRYVSAFVKAFHDVVVRSRSVR